MSPCALSPEFANFLNPFRNMVLVAIASILLSDETSTS